MAWMVYMAHFSFRLCSCFLFGFIGCIIHLFTYYVNMLVGKFCKNICKNLQKYGSTFVYCAAVEWFYSCKMVFRSVLGSLVGVRW